MALHHGCELGRIPAGFDEFRCGIESPSADRLVCDLREEPLDEVERRTGIRQEVEMKSWMFGQPCSDVLVLVSSVVKA
jgi:hypothetical protein